METITTRNRFIKGYPTFGIEVTLQFYFVETSQICYSG